MSPAALRELGLNLLQELKQIPDTGEGFVHRGARASSQADPMDLPRSA
jgi:hypothetical protein